MKTFKKTTIISLVLTILCSFAIKEATAQLYKDRNFSAQYNLGALTYFGDLKQYRYLPTVKGNNELTVGTGISAQGMINDVLAVRLNYTYGVVSGTEKNQDIYFRARVNNLSVNGLIILNRIFSDIPNSYLNNHFIIYSSLGIGKVYYKTKKFELSTDNIIESFGYEPVTSENYKQPTATIFPYGFGVTYKLNDNNHYYKSTFKDRLYFNFEVIVYNMDTDILDLTTDIENEKDKYLYTAFGVFYVF